VYRTLDGGTTWEEVNSGLPDFSEIVLLSKILIHPSNPDIMHLVTSEGLFRTTNATGACDWTFVFQPTDGGLFNIEYHPADPTTLFLSGKNVYRSSDGGLTWNELVDSGLDGVDQFVVGSGVVTRIQIALSESAPVLLYAMVLMDPTTTSDNAYFAKYENETWTELGINDQGGNQISIEADITRTAMAVNPIDEDHVLYGQDQFLEFINDYWKLYNYLPKEQATLTTMISSFILIINLEEISWFM